MKKKDMIYEIIDLYDELERLRGLEKLTETIAHSEVLEVKESFTISPIDKHMIEIGKEETLKKAIYYSWKCVNCTYDEETETYKVTPFDRWLEEKTSKDRIPDYMSFEQFKSYFHDELVAMYEKEKTKALNEARNIENVEEE